jgi:hypothetical protein
MEKIENKGIVFSEEEIEKLKRMFSVAEWHVGDKKFIGCAFGLNPDMTIETLRDFLRDYIELSKTYYK